MVLWNKGPVEQGSRGTRGLAEGTNRQVEIYEKFFIGDVVHMRKPHPCGGYEWQIVRTGADIGLICLKCGRRILIPRRKFARQAKFFVSRGDEASLSAEQDDS